MSKTSFLPASVRWMQASASGLLLLTLVLILAAALRWGANLHVFDIREVYVSGDLRHYDANSLRRSNVLGRLHGTFFTLDLQQARQAFETLPWVRKAVVRRVFPNRLQVQLEEQQVAALWGPEDSSSMVNHLGEVFDANIGELDQEQLVRLNGPLEQAPQMLAMYRLLQALFANWQFDIEQLDLSPRGSWQARLVGGTRIELGSGDEAQLRARAQRFLATVTQATANFQRQPAQLLKVDLRYPDGYAMQLASAASAAATAKQK